MPSDQAKEAPVPSRKMALFLRSKIKINEQMFRDIVPRKGQDAARSQLRAVSLITGELCSEGLPGFRAQCGSAKTT